MQNDSVEFEPKSLLEVREWKAKVSAEIEQMGSRAFTEKCREEFAPFWAELEAHRKGKPKAA
jgi:hypothetical protein